jgi:hypothetical protein
MNFNEPIVLASSSSSGAGPSLSASSKPRELPAEINLQNITTSSSYGQAGVPSAVTDSVEEARLLARKKQLELERMHEQVRSSEKG